MKVRVLAAAKREIRAAAAHYEAQRVGLENEFLSEFEHACFRLGRHSWLGRRCDGVHRRFALRRFPFAVIYRVTESAIEVVALAHRRRQPGYWSVREVVADYNVSAAA